MLLAGEFGFDDLGNSYPSPILEDFPDSLDSLPSIEEDPPTMCPAMEQQQLLVDDESTPEQVDEKPNTAEPIAPIRPLSIEEAKRLTAGEKKRRRNTAASARFRIKKKQRELAIEQNTREMTEKIGMLEGRINWLEIENKWLKNLITEKNGDKNDIASLWNEISRITQFDGLDIKRKIETMIGGGGGSIESVC
jgi:hypothetical protein